MAAQLFCNIFPHYIELPLLFFFREHHNTQVETMQQSRGDFIINKAIGKIGELVQIHLQVACPFP